MDCFYGFQEAKIKPYLKMAIQRIQITINKKAVAVKHQKREIATVLTNRKDELAFIKVEHIIREDFLIEALGLLELLLELTHERVKYIASNKECPSELIGTISALIWAESRVEIAEMETIRKQLTYKFGTKFAEAAKKNENGVVEERLVNKLSVRAPSRDLAVRYLEEIANEYNVEWVYTEVGVPLSADGIYSDEEGSRLRGAAPVAAPTGYSIPMAPGSNLGNAYSRSPTTEKSKQMQEGKQQEGKQQEGKQQEGKQDTQQESEKERQQEIRFEQQQLQFKQQQQQFQQQQLQLQQLQQQEQIKQQQQQLQQQQQQQKQQQQQLNDSNRKQQSESKQNESKQNDPYQNNLSPKIVFNPPPEHSPQHLKLHPQEHPQNYPQDYPQESPPHEYPHGNPQRNHQGNPQPQEHTQGQPLEYPLEYPIEDPSAPIMYAEAVITPLGSSDPDMPPPYEAVPVPPTASRFNDLAARFEALQKKN